MFEHAFDKLDRHLDTRHKYMASTCAHCGAVDKPYPIFELRDKIEEKTGWEGYADTDRR